MEPRVIVGGVGNTLAGDEGVRVRWLEPGRVRLFRDDSGHVRAAVLHERSVIRPALFRAFPVSAPDSFIELREEAGESVGMLRGLSGLDSASRRLAGELLRERYLVPAIREVRALRHEIGLWTWEVDTDRGERSFSIRSPRDDVRHLSGGRLRVTDTDGNIYDVQSVDGLDAQSRALLLQIIGE